MAYMLIIIGTILVVASYLHAPREFTAHAATPKSLANRFLPMGRHSSPFVTFLNASGDRVPADQDTVLINIDGTSCEEFGLKNGAKAMGHRVAAEVASTLAPGDLIVVNLSEEGLKLAVRSFRELAGDKMYFNASSKGSPTPEDTSRLWARLEYVEEPQTAA